MTQASVDTRYAFGDDAVAARRLGLVAEVFADASYAFLRGSVGEVVELAVDLGCGPGHSTGLIVEAARPRRSVGLDRSRAFLEFARATLRGDGIAFLEHDITSLPFPVGPADLLYSRFTLSHLTEPAALVRTWTTQLAPAGLLLIDEVEWIDAQESTFASYLEIVAAMLRHDERELCVGPILQSADYGRTVRRERSAVVTVRPLTSRVATMFALNLQTWRDHPFVRSLIGRSDLDRLAASLKRLETADGDGTITWGMRQMALRREE